MIKIRFFLFIYNQTYVLVPVIITIILKVLNINGNFMTQIKLWNEDLP